MGSTPKPPEAPKFYPIDIPSTLQQALETDIAGYKASDADFATRFPGLVAGKDLDIKQAFRELTGPLDPQVQNAFTQRGLERALVNTGGGNPLAGVGGIGTASGNNAAVSIANSIQQKEDYDRSYFNSLIASNPERAFGLSGADVANLSIANTGGLNAASQQQYSTTLQGIAAQGQAGVQTGQAISAIGSIFGNLSSSLNAPSSGYINYGYGPGGNSIANGQWPSDERLKENIVKIGVSPLGFEIVEFTYKPSMGLPNGRFRGVIAQQVLQIKPQAVEVDSDGWLTVDYRQLDVAHEQI